MTICPKVPLKTTILVMVDGRWSLNFLLNHVIIQLVKPILIGK